MRLSEIWDIVFITTIVTLILIPVVCAENGANNISPDTMIMPISMSVVSTAPHTSSTEQTTVSLRSPESPAINLLQSSSSSNISGIEWQDLLGGSYGETISSIQQTTDGGYIGCGSTGSPGGSGDVIYNHGFADVWVIRLNSQGAIQWQKSFGGSNWEQALSIQPTSDGGYVFAGYTKSSKSGDVGNRTIAREIDAWVVKLDSTGNLQWQTVLGGSSDDEAYSIRQTSDGGYIFAGITGATISDNLNLADHPFMGGHAWVVKLDSTGNPIWQKVFGGNSDDIATSIVQTSDGGYIFDGTTYSDNSGDVGKNHGLTDIWVVKLDPTGSIQWTKLLGGDGWDFTSIWFDDSIQQTSDGSYVVIGTTGSSADGDVELSHGSGDVWVVKLDNTGNLLWENPLGGSNMEWGMSIQQTPDGGYILAATTLSSNDGDVGQSHGSQDFWAVKLDSTGNLLWLDLLGGAGLEQVENIKATSDGGYIVSGRTSSSNSGDVTGTNHGNEDAWVVKLTPRFAVRVRDSDTGAYIPNATVGLYDYPNKKWQNLTTSNGPVAIKGATGSNPFVFDNGSVFGLNVSADGWYPLKYENATFLFTNQTVNVWMTSINRTAIGLTYSMSTPSDFKEDCIHYNNCGSELDELYSFNSAMQNASPKWTNVYSKYGTDVTKESLGSQGGGFIDSNSTLHYYSGHGSYNPAHPETNGLKLQSGYLTPSDVTRQWGGKNKWIILSSCQVLVDPNWGNALSTTHGILGFETDSTLSPARDSSHALSTVFLHYAMDEKLPVSTAWERATVDVFHEYTVWDYGNPPKKIKIVSAVRFANTGQYMNDHLPGYGIIEPDVLNPNVQDQRYAPTTCEVGN